MVQKNNQCLISDQLCKFSCRLNNQFQATSKIFVKCNYGLARNTFHHLICIINSPLPRRTVCGLQPTRFEKKYLFTILDTEPQTSCHLSKLLVVLTLGARVTVETLPRRARAWHGTARPAPTPHVGIVSLKELYTFDCVKFTICHYLTHLGILVPNFIYQSRALQKFK